MSNTQLDLREEIHSEDIDAIRQITESTGFFSAEEVDVAVELAEARLQNGPASGYYFLFAENEDSVTGYACYGPIACTVGRYDLYWIAVDDKHRGQGIGKILLDRAEELIRAMGGTRIYIETSSRAQYGPTRGFYLHCGYREEAILEDFYAPGDSKVIYCEDL